jgi:hypothetical protein
MADNVNITITGEEATLITHAVLQYRCELSNKKRTGMLDNTEEADKLIAELGALYQYIRAKGSRQWSPR